MRPSFERDDPTSLMSMGTVPPWGASRWSTGLFSLPARLWSKLLEANEQRRATAALEALDANTLAVQLDRWRIGAEHAGWKFG